MSRAVVVSGRSAETLSFTDVLGRVDKADVNPTGKNGQLGRTARMLQSALDEARSEGYAAGYAEGLEAGRKDGQEQAYREGTEQYQVILESLNREAADFANQLPESIQAFYRNAEQSLAPLAMAIARKIVAQELSTSPAIALSLVQEALLEVTHADSVRIRVNPLSSAFLREHQNEIIGACSNIRHLEIVEDPSIEGGVVVDSAGGLIDATIQKRVRKMVTGLLGDWPGSQAAPELIAVDGGVAS